MNHHTLVLPEFINDQGNLFGGYLLKWIDEFAYITASLEYPGNRFVTVSLDNVVFKEPILCGDILCFSITPERVGNTSVRYSVVVVNERETLENRKVLFQTGITFVNVSTSGRKEPIRR
jgi:acyl-CoA hydrolase